MVCEAAVTMERAQDVTQRWKGCLLVQGMEGVRFGWRERYALTQADAMENLPAFEGRAAEIAAVLTGDIKQRGSFASNISFDALRRKCGSTDDGGINIAWWDQRAAMKRDMRATRRALRKLEALGLVTVLYSTPTPSDRRRYLMYELTDLGRLVADTFRHELKTGRRIRWAKMDGIDGGGTDADLRSA